MHKSIPSDELHNAQPSTIDIKLSWYLFKQNVKPYIFIGLFTIAATLLLTFILGMITGLVAFWIGGPNVLENETYFGIIMIFIVVPMIVFLYAFFGSGYGLAYDIMSSGDQFAQFKGAFSYFKKYWWQYTLISVIYSLPNVIFNPQFLPLTQLNSYWIKYGLFLAINTLFYVWFVIVGMALPAVTAHGKFKKGLKQAFHLARKHPRRYFKTWGIYYLLFQLPGYLVMFYYEIFPLPTSVILKYIRVGAYILFVSYSLLIASPMLTLVSTRLYNSITNTDNNSDK